LLFGLIQVHLFLLLDFLLLLFLTTLVFSLCLLAAFDKASLLPARDDLVEGGAPVIHIELLSHDLKHVVHCQHTTGLKFHMVAYWQTPMSDALFVRFINGKALVPIPVNNASNYVHIVRV